MQDRHDKRSISPGGPLTGTVQVPGDKSISHRALILSSLAIGKSSIEGLLEGEDVLATAAAMRAMGADITRSDEGVWTVYGVGVGGLQQPENALDMGNSGTAARLLMGLVSSHPITTTFIGDASLSGRPMGRVTVPLGEMGAEFQGAPDGTMPIMVRGIAPAIPITYRLPVASAQVKSAVLLAGLNTPGVTRVIEPVPTRDHSENMLKGFGAELHVEQNEDGSRNISIRGEAELQAQDIIVPGDPSSAAFPVVAALITPGSDIIVTNVGMNPTRSGLFDVLKMMGGKIEYVNERETGGEPVADLRVQYSALKGIDVPANIAPSMIDEFPVLFVAASVAEGQTRTSGLEELRVKESDRLALMAEGLRRIGARAEETADGLVIEGNGGALLSGNAECPTIETSLDHRIAMSFAVAAGRTEGGLVIDDMTPIKTSFPNFEEMMASLSSAKTQ